MGDDYGGGGDSSFGGGFSESTFSPSSESHHNDDSSAGHGWSSTLTDNHETPISFGSHSAKEDNPRGGDDDRGGGLSEGGDRPTGDDVDSGCVGNDALLDVLAGGHSAELADSAPGQDMDHFQWNDPANRQSDCDNCCANGIICCCETCTIM